MKKLILAVTVGLSLALSSPLFAQPVYAANCPNENTSRGQVLQGIGATGNGCDESGVNNFISSIVNILSIIVGVAAVIVIILSGFKYITSGGDAAKVSSAKNTLIYALVGVAIAALAQFLVHFALTASTSEPLKPCPTGSHRSADGKLCIPDPKP